MLFSNVIEHFSTIHKTFQCQTPTILTINNLIHVDWNWTFHFASIAKRHFTEVSPQAHSSIDPGLKKSYSFGTNMRVSMMTEFWGELSLQEALFEPVGCPLQNEGHEDGIREEKRSSLRLKANPKGVEQSTCTSNQQTMRQGLRFPGIDREFLKTGLPGPGIILLGLPNPSVTWPPSSPWYCGLLCPEHYD